LRSIRSLTGAGGRLFFLADLGGRRALWVADGTGPHSLVDFAANTTPPALLTAAGAGDHARERAVTLGDIARLRAQAGDVDDAHKLKRENLEISRGLGDLDCVANSQFFLAQLELQKGRSEDALPRLAESWDINCRIGRADGIAIVGAFYGQLLIPTDRPRAISILQTSRAAFQKLGMTPYVGQIDDLLKRLAGDQP
jgi:hypothetical protein